MVLNFSYHQKEQHGMRLTLNSWGIWVVTHTSSTPTCLAKARVIGSNNFTSGLTQLQIFTPIPSSGTLNVLCKFLDAYYAILQILLWTNITTTCFVLLLLWFPTCDRSKVLSPFLNLFYFRFSVDGSPIREFKNMESKGVPFPKNQAMRIYSSLWNADDWATRGGLVKTDWSQAPFTASYRNFNANACTVSSGTSSCSNSASSPNAWLSEELDSTSQEKLKWVQNNYMIYNYCTDTKRFPQALPTECNTA